jgi:hypothetical protein
MRCDCAISSATEGDLKVRQVGLVGFALRFALESYQPYCAPQAGHQNALWQSFLHQELPFQVWIASCLHHQNRPPRPVTLV